MEPANGKADSKPGFDTENTYGSLVVEIVGDPPVSTDQGKGFIFSYGGDKDDATGLPPHFQFESYF
jgi:hypothetical protein